MKKTNYSFLIAVVAILTLGQAAFAIQSDLQVLLGGEGVITTLDAQDEVTLNCGAFNLCVENYNLFPLGGNFFSLGFMEGFGVSLGGVSSIVIDSGAVNSYKAMLTSDAFDSTFAWGIHLMAGPAVAFSFGDAAKLQIMGAFAFRYMEAKYERPYTVYDDAGRYVASVTQGEKFSGLSLGVAAGVQVKFLPRKAFSPLVGFRYEYTAWDGFTNELSQDSVTLEEDIEDALSHHVFTGTLGFAINFGKF